MRPPFVIALHRGIGHSIVIEENTGVVLSGKIAAVGEQSFTLRLSSDPAPLAVRYMDIAGFPRRGPHGTTIIMLSAIGAGAALGIWGFVHVHNLSQQNQPLSSPPGPAVP